MSRCFCRLTSYLERKLGGTTGMKLRRALYSHLQAFLGLSCLQMPRPEIDFHQKDALPGNAGVLNWSLPRLPPAQSSPPSLEGLPPCVPLPRSPPRPPAPSPAPTAVGSQGRRLSSMPHGKLPTASLGASKCMCTCITAASEYL